VTPVVVAGGGDVVSDAQSLKTCEALLAWLPEATDHPLPATSPCEPAGPAGDWIKHGSTVLPPAIDPNQNPSPVVVFAFGKILDGHL
jgi:hypothetical protein